MPATHFIQDGVEVFASGEPGRYLFIPRVEPETTAAGDPTLLLLKTGETALLQLGVQLTVSPAVLERILAALKSQQTAPIPIHLEPALLAVRSVRLLLATSSGEEELARAGSSGLPPYTALFRVVLNADQTKLVEKALAAEPKLFRAVYEFDLCDKAGAAVQVSGDVTEAVRRLAEDHTDSNARACVEQGLASGALKITADAWGVQADELLARATETARAKAAAMLLAMENPTLGAGAERSDRVLSEVKLEEPRAISSTRAADIATWYAGGKKPVTFGAPVSTPPPPGVRPTTVRMGSLDKDAPLAFIEIKGDDGKTALLRGPSWQPVTLSSSGRLTMTVRYATGDPPWTTELVTETNDRSLEMAELGIVRIAVDASARKAAGANRLNATITYLQGDAAVQTWPVQFRFGDWEEQWFLVTRAPGLNGVLEYQWQETRADGSVASGGPLQTNQPVIRIE